MLSFRRPRNPQPILMRDEESMEEVKKEEIEIGPRLDSRAQRLKFISERVAEIRKRQMEKRTFLTDPNFVEEKD
jgi:hypothetical protein